MRKYHDLLRLLITAGEDEADVHRIGVADRDAGLQIFEEGVPGTAERVRAQFEIAEVFHSIYFSLWDCLV